MILKRKNSLKIMTKDNNQNKQLTELSDQELENVNGGINVREKWSLTGSNTPLFIVDGVQSGNPAAGIGGAACPDSEKDEFGKCPQINID